MPVELSLDGVAWGLANGEVPVPVRGSEESIDWLIYQVRELFGELTTIPNARYLRVTAIPGSILVAGVTNSTESVVQVVLKAAAADAP